MWLSTNKIILSTLILLYRSSLKIETRHLRTNCEAKSSREGKTLSVLGLTFTLENNKINVCDPPALNK